MTDADRSHPRRCAAAALSLGLIAAVLACMGTSASAAAAPASSVQGQIVPVAGDSHLLVFGTKRSTAVLRGSPLSGGTELHLLTKSGHKQVLGETGPGYDTAVSVVGPIVELFDYDDLTLRWWNVTSHVHGSISVASGDAYVGASPTGFVYERQEGDEHLVEETFAGHTTDLGDPINPDQEYAAITATAGIVVTQSDLDVGNGQTAYLSWSKPGTFRQLHSVSQGGTSCTAVSGRYAACQDELLPLNGGALIRGHDRTCYGAAAVFHSSAVWACGGGRLHALSPTGQVSSSHQHVAARQAVVAALGRLFVSSPDESKLLSLTSITSAPTVVIRAS